MPTFGTTIRELRKQRGISQKELAERIGIDFTYLSKIENDRMPAPSEKKIQAMAEVLGADTDELIRLAGKIPSDLAAFLIAEPEAMRHLRALQGDVRTRADWQAELKREERT